jgi:hypothetical protein
VVKWHLTASRGAPETAKRSAIRRGHCTATRSAATANSRGKILRALTGQSWSGDDAAVGADYLVPFRFTDMIYKVAVEHPRELIKDDKPRWPRKLRVSFRSSFICSWKTGWQVGRAL